MKKTFIIISAILFACSCSDFFEKTPANEFDADILCLYSAEDDPAALSAAVQAWNEQGKSVLLQREIPAQMRFGEIVRFAVGGEGK